MKNRRTTTACSARGALVTLAATGLLISGCGQQTDDVSPTSAPAPTTAAAAEEPTTDDATSERTTSEEPTTEATSEEPTSEETSVAGTTSDDSSTEDDSTADDSSTEDDSTEDDSTEDGGGAAGAPDGALDLTADTVEGLPSDGPAQDITAAVEAELGAPESTLTVPADCNAQGELDHWMWDGFELTDRESEVWWRVSDGISVDVHLPDGLELGMSEEDLRAASTVSEESVSGGGWPILVLDNGLAVTLDPGARTVTDVASEFTPTC